MILQFDEPSHTYTLGGSVLPSVTQVLAPLSDFSRIRPDVLEIARQKGVAVHKMVELDCRADLDEGSLDDWMVPVLGQWRKFVSESGFTLLKSEYRVHHSDLRYAGTLDLLGTMNDGVAFIDVKRSFAAGPVIGLQLAAYQEAYCHQEKVGRSAKRYALKLNENGAYRLEPFADKTDFQMFLSLLNIHNWKRKNHVN